MKKWRLRKLRLRAKPNVISDGAEAYRIIKKECKNMLKKTTAKKKKSDK